MRKKKVEMWQLQQRQGLPLEAKIIFSKQRIKDWLVKWQHNCYVSFSGGKDSTVLLDLVRQIDSKIPAVFCNTGLEYPEVLDFIKTIDNVITIYPEKSFKTIIETYGYPVVSKEQSLYIEQYLNAKSEKTKKLRWNGNEEKHYKISEKWKFLIDAPFKISPKCCDYLKKKPFLKYEKETSSKPFIGVMAANSSLRKSNYLRYGCNAFEASRPYSMPLGIWTDEDIWGYIKKYNLPYSNIYNLGFPTTGCAFCLFGIQHDASPNRIEKLKTLHPSIYNYCLNKLKMKEVLDFMNIPY